MIFPRVSSENRLNSLVISFTMKPNRISDTAGVNMQEKVAYNNSWALVVGINEYQHEKIPGLNFAENDAKALASVLRGLDFPRQNIELMLGSEQEVTRERILDVMESKLNPNMEEEDRFLFYFAGHGVSYKTSRQERGYILMKDSEIYGRWPNRSEPYLKKMPGKSLDMGILLERVKALPAKHKLLLMDSCFSGFMISSREGLPAGPSKNINKRLEQWLSEPVTQVLTAGRSGQQSFEKEGYGHGVFTRYLLKGLEGFADPRKDGIISFMDLAAYVRDRVAQELAVKQDPQWGTYDGEGQFFFVYKTGDGGKQDVYESPVVREGKSYKVALRVEDGTYVGAAGGGGGLLMAVSKNIKEWETFFMIEQAGGKVNLKAHNGQYVSAEGGGGGRLSAGNSFAGAFETFELIDLGNHKVALQTHDGHFVSSQRGEGRELVADRTVMRDPEVFFLVKLDSPVNDG
jgi:hypothetical protein